MTIEETTPVGRSPLRRLVSVETARNEVGEQKRVWLLNFPTVVVERRGTSREGRVLRAGRSVL